LLWSLEGTLRKIQPHYVVLEVSGVFFQVFIPASFYFQMPGVGENIHLYTYLQVREDEFILYGFQTGEERDAFKTILGVSRIGTRVALNLLGHLSLAQLAEAIKNENEHLLTSIPGIGNKTAKRLVYELKEKVSSWQGPEFAPVPGEQGGNWADIQQALLSLGYSSREVARARKSLQKEGDTSMENLFKKALALLAG
jgi:Holliday junction DNA helicase RuvA